MKLLRRLKKRIAVPKQSKIETRGQIVQKGKKPVIGLVVTTFDKGGLEQVVLNLYLGYKKNGYNVFMLCQENILGIMAQQVEQNELYVFNSDMRLFIDFIYAKNITVLHYHYNVFGVDEVKQLGVRTLYTMHNVYTWKNSEEMRIYSQILNKMDKVVPVSNLVKNYYLARSGSDAKKLQVIYNGIDFDELDLTDLPEELERKNLDIGNDDIVIGFVASFYPVKYQIGMIGVMEELVQKYNNIKLLYIGNNENEYYQKFLGAYKKSTARDYMKVVPYFEHRYMGEFLRRIVDIFTLPTLQEGCSNAVLEAIYCNKPMVLTNVGNAMDVNHLPACEVVRTAYESVVTTSNAKMIQLSTQKDSANKKELVSAFCKVIDNLEEYKEKAVIGQQEKEIYATHYMVHQYIDVIETLTGSSD